MPLFGSIVVIKRTGEDGSIFPLTASKCVFGRALDCDIRIFIPSVSRKHCYLEVNEDNQVYVVPFEDANPTALNNKNINGVTIISHGDVITICERSFRFEYPPKSVFCTPSKLIKQQSPNRLKQLAKLQLSEGPYRKSGKTSNNIADTTLSPSKSPFSSKTPQKKISRRASQGRLSSRKVSFGPCLSPEQFNKILPPSTPVHKGGVPKRRVSTPDYFGSPIVTSVSSMKNKGLLAPPFGAIQEESPSISVKVVKSLVKTPMKQIPSPQSPKNNLRISEKNELPLEKKISDSPNKSSKKKMDATPIFKRKSLHSRSTSKSTPRRKTYKNAELKATSFTDVKQRVYAVQREKVVESQNFTLSPAKSSKVSLTPGSQQNRTTRASPGTIKRKLAEKITPKFLPKQLSKRSRSRKLSESLEKSNDSPGSSKKQASESLTGKKYPSSLENTEKQIAIVSPFKKSLTVPSTPVMADSKLDISSSWDDTFSPDSNFKLKLSSSSSSSPGSPVQKDSDKLLSKSGLKQAVSVPKIQSPSSPDRRKSKALRNIHGSKLHTQSSKKSLSQKKTFSVAKKSATKTRKPLFSEVLKLNLTKKKSSIIGKPSLKVGRRAKTVRKAKAPMSLKKSKAVGEASTTGHANSPDTIIIGRKKKVSSIIKTRKGRKTPHKNEVNKLKQEIGRRKTNSLHNISGITELMKTPRESSIFGTQLSQQTMDTSLNLTAPDASSISPSFFISPLSASNVGSSTRFSRKSPENTRKSTKASPGLTGVKKLFRSPRKSVLPNYIDVSGVKSLFKSPDKSPKAKHSRVSGIKKLFKSPVEDYSDLNGVKLLFDKAKLSPRANYSLTDIELDRLFNTSQTSQPVSPSKKRKSSPVKSVISSSPSQSSSAHAPETPINGRKIIVSGSVKHLRRGSKYSEIPSNLHFTPAPKKSTPASSSKRLKVSTYSANKLNNSINDSSFVSSEDISLDQHCLEDQSAKPSRTKVTPTSLKNNKRACQSGLVSPKATVIKSRTTPKRSSTLTSSETTNVDQSNNISALGNSLTEHLCHLTPNTELSATRKKKGSPPKSASPKTTILKGPSTPKKRSKSTGSQAVSSITILSFLDAGEASFTKVRQSRSGKIDGPPLETSGSPKQFGSPVIDSKVSDVTKQSPSEGKRTNVPTSSSPSTPKHFAVRITRTGTSSKSKTDTSTNAKNVDQFDNISSLDKSLSENLCHFSPNTQLSATRKKRGCPPKSASPKTTIIKGVSAPQKRSKSTGSQVVDSIPGIHFLEAGEASFTKVKKSRSNIDGPLGMPGSPKQIDSPVTDSKVSDVTKQSSSESKRTSMPMSSSPSTPKHFGVGITRTGSSGKSKTIALTTPSSTSKAEPTPKQRGRLQNTEHTSSLIETKSSAEIAQFPISTEEDGTPNGRPKRGKRGEKLTPVKTTKISRLQNNENTSSLLESKSSVEIAQFPISSEEGRTPKGRPKRGKRGEKLTPVKTVEVSGLQNTEDTSSLIELKSSVEIAQLPISTEGERTPKGRPKRGKRGGKLTPVKTVEVSGLQNTEDTSSLIELKSSVEIAQLPISTEGERTPKGRPKRGKRGEKLTPVKTVEVSGLQNTEDTSSLIELKSSVEIAQLPISTEGERTPKGRPKRGKHGEKLTLVQTTKVASPLMNLKLIQSSAGIVQLPVSSEEDQTPSRKTKIGKRGQKISQVKSTKTNLNQASDNQVAKGKKRGRHLVTESETAVLNQTDGPSPPQKQKLDTDLKTGSINVTEKTGKAPKRTRGRKVEDSKLVSPLLVNSFSPAQKRKQSAEISTSPGSPDKIEHRGTNENVQNEVPITRNRRGGRLLKTDLKAPAQSKENITESPGKKTGKGKKDEKPNAQKEQTQSPVLISTPDVPTRTSTRRGKNMEKPVSPEKPTKSSIEVVEASPLKKKGRPKLGKTVVKKNAKNSAVLSPVSEVSTLSPIGGKSKEKPASPEKPTKSSIEEVEASPLKKKGRPKMGKTVVKKNAKNSAVLSPVSEVSTLSPIDKGTLAHKTKRKLDSPGTASPEQTVASRRRGAQSAKVTVKELTVSPAATKKSPLKSKKRAPNSRKVNFTSPLSSVLEISAQGSVPELHQKPTRRGRLATQQNTSEPIRKTRSARK